MSTTSMTNTSADHTSFAIAMLLLGVSVVAIMDLVTKWISSDISLWQLLFMRSLFGLLMLVPTLLLFRQLPKIWAKKPRAVLIRSAIMVFAYLTFFTSLAVLPIALVAGSFFSSPLFVVMLSAVMLKESIGIWRVVSVIAGFLGVLLIIRPDSADFQWMFLLPVAAGFFYALTQVFTRKYCKDEDPLAISAWQTALFLLVGSLGMLGLAVLPATQNPGFLSYPLIMTDSPATLLIIGLAIGSLVMHFLLAAAYQNAPASLVAPLEYLYLPLAVLGGVVFFAETPSTSALLGIIIIVVSGLIIAWRERRLREKALLVSS